MEATSTTTQHAYRVGLFGPNQAHGLQPGQGPRDPGCYGAQCPEDQTSHTHPPPNSQHHHHQQQNHQPHHHIQHSRPFFYVQPSQPYPPPLPYQWPMPMPYSPYCSFPGMGGYGVMMPNPFQAGPYMEHPGYVLAQSQLHLADYRRMINPHYHTTHHPQTMAYHARRLRYQHSAPPAREMINCEVQTDTLSAAESQLSEVAESASRIKVQTNSDSYTSCAGPQSLSNTSTIKEVTSKSADYQGRIISAATSANIPVDARSTALQKGSFVFQDEIEEVRIECGSSLTGLKIHTSLSQEADVMATTTQRVAHSVSGTGGDWVQLFSSLHPPANGSVQHSEAHGTGQQHQQEEGGMGPCQDEVEDDDERSLRVCPDIPLMAKAPSNDWSTEKFSAIEECNSDLVNTLAEPPGNSVSSIDPKVVDQSHNADSPHLLNDGEEVNVANQYLEELKNVQCLEMVSAWSVKAVVPYEPSPMLTIQQGSTQLPRESLSPVMEVTVAEEGPIVEEVHVMEEVLMSEEDVQKVLEGLVVKEVGPVVQEAPVREAVSMAQIPVNEVVPRLEEISRMEEPLPAIQSPDKTDAPPSPQTSQKRAEMSDIDHQDTSFEALPTHLSATWLSDWGNMCYYSKLPCNVEEQRQILRCSPLKPSSPRVKTNLTRELNVTHCGAVNMVSHGLKGDGCRHRGMEDGRSYSDHECSANRSLNQNTLTPGGSKRDRICARCLIMKRRASKTTGSPGVEAHVIKQQGVSIPLWEESVLAQTCAACKCIPRRRVARKGSGSDVQSGFHNRETSEGETSENSFQARPGTPKPRDIKDPRRPLDPKPQFFMKSHSGTCSVAPQSKLREKNCSCEEPHHHGRPAAMWVGQTRPWRHHHGNVIREQNEENLGVAVSTPLQDKWRNQEPQYLTTQGWQQEKLRAVTSTADYTDGSRNVHRPRSLNTQKKHVSQSQGMIRKDNRC
ncbi:hypothetical protein UPYG_G00070690 [Umbra pygmaea]|uniref:Uncharacterized protein n=1 Tax=Umbra pygmaea TaxID=75934 RepID=A0ABD0XC19_UMBPY